MIGDINLFLFDDDEDDEEGSSTSTTPKQIIGEIELMIALKSHHRKGHGRASLLAFLSYVLTDTTAVLSEYTQGTSATLKILRVKINKDNVKSIALFESVGFERTSAEANYFGEVELRIQVKGKEEDVLKGLEKVKGWKGRPFVAGYGEV